jgi:dihydrofolate reductase
MRKIIVLEFITLDGVMQAGGSPDEDTSDGFRYGGWAAPYLDAGTAGDEFMAKQLKPADLLLGRKTYGMFASFWPAYEDMWPGVNNVTKYVVSGTDIKLDGWNNSVRLNSASKTSKSSKNQKVVTSRFMVAVTWSRHYSNMIWLMSYGSKFSRLCLGREKDCLTMARFQPLLH